MKTLRWILLASMASGILPAVDLPEKMMETLWTQTSVEWRGLARQAYRSATIALDKALKDKNWTAALEQTGGYRKLPPAVILDVDETVLDNSPAQARQVLIGQGFEPSAWHVWVMESAAAPVPGAVEFCRYAASRKVKVLYITNRDANQEEATRANLLKHGFPVDPSPDGVLSLNEQPGWESDKASRRRHLAERYRIVMLVGDDLNDFLSGVKAPVEERHEKAAPYEGWWGMRWIMLPNPTYGSWESAIYLPGKPQSLEEKRLRREQLLKTR